MTTATSTASVVETLQEALQMLVASNLYDTKRHLYYCLSNRLAIAIHALRNETSNNQQANSASEG